MTVSFPIDNYLPTIIEKAESFRQKTSWLNSGFFTGNDTTGGMEYELQVAVEGTNKNVDLPISIKQSSYFKNLIKRTERGDCPEQVVNDIESFLNEPGQLIWENSWVRLKTDCLSGHAARIAQHDFLADKSEPKGPLRADRHRFFTIHRGEKWLRLPISYILKLSLADCLGRENKIPADILVTGETLQKHFISDNTSPEILSLSIADKGTTSIGDCAGRETARTYLFSQLLIQYGNSQFGLRRTGQRALLYFAPQAPMRQKRINDLVPDSFYRQLFMSPCLSGWDKGEEKHLYMELCHRTLSRSQLNTIGKLKEAGIITNNLIVQPNTSNTCLANNGTHVSLGSRLLYNYASDKNSGFTPQVEKYFGDLVIKIVEHFLPLLVTTFSAAPYRIDYVDFHPEKVLGFLPHELDYTHLRMLWRRWKKKADISICGNPLTPFGPYPLDRLISMVSGVKGDLVPDFRLIDYLVALLSTETSPCLNGIPGNQELLKRDLAEMGVFDKRMSIYLPYRLREYSSIGYSGFEGRFYSLFPSMLRDMSNAVDMQNLFTALAYQYILDGKVNHRDIPDSPSIESERRQIFFAAAIGIPTVFIDKETKNRFLLKILTKVENKRNSGRYKGYIRIKIKEYNFALLKLIKEDFPNLIEKMESEHCLDRLEQIVSDSNLGASFHFTSETIKTSSKRATPLSISAKQFNDKIEKYYRDQLRLEHIKEGLAVLKDDCRDPKLLNGRHFEIIKRIIGTEIAPADLFCRLEQDILKESLQSEKLRKLILVCLIIIHQIRNSSEPC